MKNFLLSKLLIEFSKKIIFIFILIVSPFSNSFSDENIFTVSNIKVEGPIDLSFSRDNYLNKAFIDSFQILMEKILLTRDLKKINDVKLKEIKNLINSFQIVEETYRKNQYTGNIKIYYNDIKVKKFLSRKNISFSQSENISAVFFPVLFTNNEVRSFDENFLYKRWLNVEIKNKLLNFILPLEDLDDISKIVKMKNRIEEMNVDDLVNKYDIKNYVFALADYNNLKLSIHLKINFNNNKVNKNFLYDLKDIDDEPQLDFIIKDLKIKTTDFWKEANLINFLMPLSITIKFQHENIKELDKLRNIFYKISIIEEYDLEKFNINNSFFKIYYYGNPKKLKSELLKFGYQLSDDKGFWQLYLNE